MGRAPCCSKIGLHRGPWTPREDTLLNKYIQAHGEGHWRSLPKKAGLLRCGKSCRLRWMNYLRPDIKRGNITPDEDDLIIRMHSLLGNRWSLIAGRLPGRTDNEVKNYWNTHLSKRLRSQGTDPNTHKKLSEQPVLQREVKTKRRRNNSSTSKISTANNNNNKKQNKRKEKLLLEPEKPKVHHPKPVRFTCLSLPRNDDDSFVGCNKNNCLSPSSQRGSGDEGYLGGTAEEAVDVPWCNFKDVDDHGVEFLVGEVDQDHGLGLVNNGSSSDLECTSSLLPATNSSLEKLYEEYLELLETDDEDQGRLDSFAESLLA